MLSYEEIFKRHSRPVTFLSGHLDSPITRIPSPMIRRSQVAYKERHRPTSIACLDSLRSYRDNDVMIPRYFNDDYRPSTTDSVSRILNEGFKLPLKENVQRTSRNYYNPPAEDVIGTKIMSGSPTLPRKDRTHRVYNEEIINGCPTLPRKDRTHKVYNEQIIIGSPTLPRKDRTHKIFEEQTISGSHTLPRKDRTHKVFNESENFSLKENSPRILTDSYRYPVRDVKSNNSSDNYRHAVSFPDSHLSRRELPLCTPDELLDIIREPAGYYALPTDAWNEVYPDVYLSDAPTALCTAVLKRLGVTHVLNAAQGKEKGCGQVNTTSGFYLNSGIKFLGVPAFDNIVFKLHPYFEQAAQYIDDALQSKGKVLVHCRAGISRSATLVCAFLMIKRGMTVQEAVRSVRKHREIIPNDGFLQQLCDLNDRLKRKNRSWAS